MDTRVYEIEVISIGSFQNTVFVKISVSQAVSQNFSLLPYQEGGRAPSSNTVRKQAVYKAIFRVLRIACTVSKIYRGCIPPRTLNSSHQVALYSGSHQDFTEVS